MGNNNSMINIKFDQPQPRIYYTGDIISGEVQFMFSEHAINIDDIELTIIGNVGYTKMRTTRTPNGQIDRQTVPYDIRIFVGKIVLGQAISTQKNQANNNTNDMITIEAGRYTYPFSARLPDVLPPTLHPQDYPFVRYELELFIEKKWPRTNTRHVYPLRIYPRINLLHIQNSQCGVKFDTSRKDITIKGIIQRSGVIPGETIALSLELYNPIHLVIKRVDVCLIQRYEIELCRRRLEILRSSIPELSDINNEHINTIHSIIIPIGIAPSYSSNSKGKYSSVHVHIRYDIKLEVKVKGFFSDFELLVPIIIGTDSVEHSSHADMTTTSMDLNAIDKLEPQVDDDNDGILQQPLTEYIIKIQLRTDIKNRYFDYIIIVIRIQHFDNHRFLYVLL